MDLTTKRLRRLQQVMGEKGLGSLILTNPIHIRYATGTDLMQLWTAVNLARYAYVPAQGEPVIFEYEKALFRTRPRWKRARPQATWQQRFAQETAPRKAREFAEAVRVLRKEDGVEDGRVGVDMMDFYGFTALLEAGLPVTDADETLQEARRVKLPEEIPLVRQSCEVAEVSLREMERSITPGITEEELFGVFWGCLLAQGGEHCSTRLLVSGEKTNPWFQEAGSRQVRDGDLVAIDTDMTGPEGYLCDISRTFLCGDRPTDEAKEAYRVAFDFIQGTIELCRPGVELREIREKAPRVPAEYEEQAYSCQLHGAGLDDEVPFLPLAADEKGVVPKGSLEPNMVICVEAYAGKKGGECGVKLEEQILITENGPELLAEYPFEERLL